MLICITTIIHYFVVYLYYEGEFTILSKWSIYQLISLLYIIILFYIVEQFNDTPPSSLMIMGFIIAIVGWIYVMLYLQLKKKPDLLEHPIWGKMPFIIFGIGLLAFILFIVSADMGPLNSLITANRSLLYVFIMFFVLLLFLFVMSLVHKLSESKHNVLNHTLFATIALLIITLFML